MSTTPELVAGLRKKGVELRLEGGGLRYSAAPEALTQEDIALLRGRREELVGFLQARKAAERKDVIKTTAPLAPSFSQEVWWHWAKDAGPEANSNIAFTVTLDDCDEEQVQSALRAVIARHDILRYAFQEKAGQVVIQLNPPAAFKPQRDDLRHLGDEDALALAKSQAQQFCSRPVPQDAEWLTRARIFLLPSRKVLLAMACNHIIIDGTSCAILLEDLHKALKGTLEPDSPSRLQFQDYQAAERAWIEGPRGDILVRYWRRWTDVLPPLLTPEKRNKLQWTPGEKIRHEFFLEASVRDGLHQLSRRIGATDHLVHLTIFAIALSRWSGQRDFALRNMSDMRLAPELLGVVGFMFCADAVAIHMPKATNFETALRAIEIEYNATVQRRLPTMPMGPPYAVHPGIEGAGHPSPIGATFNFIPFRGDHSGEPEAIPPRGPPAWPPVTEYFSEQWRINTVPLYFQLMDMGAGLQGRLQFNAALIIETEQAAFLTAFFAVLRETLDARA